MSAHVGTALLSDLGSSQVAPITSDRYQIPVEEAGIEPAYCARRLPRGGRSVRTPARRIEEREFEAIERSRCLHLVARSWPLHVVSLRRWVGDGFAGWGHLL